MLYISYAIILKVNELTWAKLFWFIMYIHTLMTLFINLCRDHLQQVIDGALKNSSILRPILENKEVAMKLPVHRHGLRNMDSIRNH